ncbi:MAG: hypothetical protein PVG39_27335 [Desulfobacteraceae bacterium]|jgi:hypothetical protein
MYRVAVIINENEVAHSRYADTIGTLRSAAEESNAGGARGNSYNFLPFDRFDINRLFSTDVSGLMSFDAIVVGTNAMAFGERIHNVFCEHKVQLQEYLDVGKGLFILSQRKLSNESLGVVEPQSVGFLPETLDYYAFFRPEKHSALGNVSIFDRGPITDYPDKINNEMIANHCEHNEFLVHRYRSIIIPRFSNSYDTVLCDESSPSITQNSLSYHAMHRKLLLCSRYNPRVVITTMALDWADHRELLTNILVYITKDRPITYFIRDQKEKYGRAGMNSYIARANTANIPYRVIQNSEIDTLDMTSGCSFIFSSSTSANDVKDIYKEMV